MYIKICCLVAMVATGYSQKEPPDAEALFIGEVSQCPNESGGWRKITFYWA